MYYLAIEHKGRNLDKGKQRVIIDIQKGEIESAITHDIDHDVKDSTNLLKDTSITQIILNELLKVNFKKGAKLFGEDITEASKYCYFMGISIRVVLSNEDTHIDFVKNSLNRSSIENNIIGLSTNVNIYDEIPRIILSSRDDIIIKEDVAKYNKEIAELSKLIRLFKPLLMKIEIEKKENGNLIRCSKYFNYGKYKVWSDFESTGIKKLISLYTAFKSFNIGGMVFIDELDSNLHDVYLCKMLEYFPMYGKGQLCFTTHNLGPMEILCSKKHSIDFLSDNNKIVAWIKQGNYSVKNMYKSGMIDNSPFNVEPFDFLGIFGGD